MGFTIFEQVINPTLVATGATAIYGVLVLQQILYRSVLAFDPIAQIQADTLERVAELQQVSL